MLMLELRRLFLQGSLCSQLLQADCPATSTCAKEEREHSPVCLKDQIFFLLGCLAGILEQLKKYKKDIEFQQKAKKIDTIPVRPLPLGENFIKYIVCFNPVL